MQTSSDSTRCIVCWKSHKLFARRCLSFVCLFFRFRLLALSLVRQPVHRCAVWIRKCTTMFAFLSGSILFGLTVTSVSIEIESVRQLDTNAQTLVIFGKNDFNWNSFVSFTKSFRFNFCQRRCRRCRCYEREYDVNFSMGCLCVWACACIRFYPIKLHRDMILRTMLLIHIMLTQTTRTQQQQRRNKQK